MVKDFGRRDGWPGGKRKDWRGSRHSRESRESHLRSPYNHNKLNLGVSHHRRVRRAVEQEGRAREEEAWTAGSSGMEMKSDWDWSCGHFLPRPSLLLGHGSADSLVYTLSSPLGTGSFNRCFYSFRLKIEKLNRLVSSNWDPLPSTSDYLLLYFSKLNCIFILYYLFFGKKLTEDWNIPFVNNLKLFYPFNLPRNDV